MLRKGATASKFKEVILIKKIVALDTSICRRVPDDINLDELYPKEKYLRFVQDTVIDEMYPKLVDFFKDNDILIFPSLYVILLNELSQQPFNLMEVEKQKDILKILDTDNSKNAWYEDLRKKAIEDKKRLYSEIRDIDSNEFETTIQSIKIKLEGYIIKSDTIKFTITSSEEHLYAHDIIGEITGKSIWINCKNATRQNLKLLHFFMGINDLQSRFPFLYEILIFSIFMDELRKPSVFKKGKKSNDSFLINSGEIKHIRIDENTLPDFKISLGSLIHADIFATCDESQRKLIHALYPQYKSKVQLFKKDEKLKKYILH